MTVKTSGRATVPSSYFVTINGNTVAYNCGQLVEGDCKYISSIYDGGFVAGRFRVNPVVIRKTSSHCLSGSYRSTYKISPFTVYDVSGAWMQSADSPYFFNPESQKFVWNQNLANQALIKAYSASKNAILQGGVVLAELGETVKMLRNPLRELINLLRKPTIKNASNQWLMYRYGIRPLMKDISDAIQLIKKGFRQSEKLRRSRGTVKSTDVTRARYTGRGFNVFTCDEERQTKTEYKTTAVVYYSFKASTMSKLEDLGLSPFDLPGIAWEVVPLSFVVDWFVKVAPWLEAIKPAFSITYFGNCVSQKTVTDFTIDIVGSNSAASYNVTNVIPSRYIYKETALERRTNQSLPALPPVNFDYHDFKHVNDSTALLSQRATKLLRRLR